MERGVDCIKKLKCFFISKGRQNPSKKAKAKAKANRIERNEFKRENYRANPFRTGRTVSAEYRGDGKTAGRKI